MGRLAGKRMAKPESEDSRQVVDWLMAGDPAIRWQTQRDLRGVAESTIRRERARVAREGWGAQLLALQDDDARWGGGIYTPKWISTTYTLLLLRSMGLAPNRQVTRGAERLIEKGLWHDGGINYYPHYGAKFSETCISGMVLAILCWCGFDDPCVDRLAVYMLERQMKDGGWNCRSTPGYGTATHGSFHTTITALEALLEYERFRPQKAAPVREAQARGREFLLIHRLYRSHRTGEVAKPVFLRFVFPPRWHYDVLRGLDYFQDVGADRDERLADPIAVLESQRHADGRWIANKEYRAKVFFELETVGEPSRWNTLRALRVLRWWNRS